MLLRNCGEVRILTDFYPVPCIDWFLYPVLYMYNNFNWFLSCHIHWFYFYPVTYIDFIFILSHTVILFLSCHIHWFYFYPVTYSDFIFILSYTFILFLSCHIQWFCFYPVTYSDFIFKLSYTCTVPLYSYFYILLPDWV